MIKSDRDYQSQIKKETLEAWGAGHQNIFWRLPTGSGKTHTFTSLVAELGQPTVLIAHRDKLLTQMSLDLARKSVRHNIFASRETIRSIIAIHCKEFGRSYYERNAQTHVASVDNMRNRTHEAWMDRIQLLVQDEGHHCLRDNKWGAVARNFKNAKGVYPTATPKRTDGMGLSRGSDGVGDILLEGPTERELMERGYLSRYKVFCPPNDVDLSGVSVTATGDYSPLKLRHAVHKSHVVGDVVQHYLKLTPGKLGLTFAVDIESAQDLSDAYNRAGVRAEVLTGNTDVMLRYELLRRFEDREILQLVSVDILGEGTDIPAVEVVSDARPSWSLVKVMQHWGRLLRPFKGKEYGTIIDHVGNVLRHGLPDCDLYGAERIWTLERETEKRSKGAVSQSPLRVCLNPACMSPYERFRTGCPFCGEPIPAPRSRGSIEQVEGDLIELDAEVIRSLRARISQIDAAPRYPSSVSNYAAIAIQRNHAARQNAQHILRENISLLAGYWRQQGNNDREIHRRFYATYGTDILSAQTLGSSDCGVLTDKLISDIKKAKIVVDK